MEQTYFNPPKDSAVNKKMEPKPETIRKILEFSRTLKVVKTDTISMEYMLN